VFFSVSIYLPDSFPVAKNVPVAKTANAVKTVIAGQTAYFN
jgi:hypothetical protein